MLARAEKWLLRVSHVVALLLVFVLSSLAAWLGLGPGLLWMGYLLLSLLVLVRGTWRQAMRTISRNRRGAWLGRSSAIAGAIFRNPANPNPPTHARRPRLGAAQGQREKQWEERVGGGLAWRAAHRYAWLVLLLILVYQVVVGSG